MSSGSGANGRGSGGNHLGEVFLFSMILKFSKQERPHFGANIFNNNQHRIIIEYSSAYPISLKYDQKLNYIVYDHIEPIDGISINNFNIYATNLSYDILQKTEFGWELKENIYLNNEK